MCVQTPYYTPKATQSGRLNNGARNSRLMGNALVDENVSLAEPRGILLTARTRKSAFGNPFSKNLRGLRAGSAP